MDAINTESCFADIQIKINNGLNPSDMMGWAENNLVWKIGDKFVTTGVS